MGRQGPNGVLELPSWDDVPPEEGDNSLPNALNTSKCPLCDLPVRGRRSEADKALEIMGLGENAFGLYLLTGFTTCSSYGHPIVILHEQAEEESDTEESDFGSFGSFGNFGKKRRKKKKSKKKGKIQSPRDPLAHESVQGLTPVLDDETVAIQKAIARLRLLGSVIFVPPRDMQLNGVAYSRRQFVVFPREIQEGGGGSGTKGVSGSSVQKQGQKSSQKQGVKQGPKQRKIENFFKSGS